MPGEKARPVGRGSAHVGAAICLKGSLQCGLGPGGARPGQPGWNIIYIMRNVVSGLIRFVGSAWQWLRLWLGSCLPTGTPDKDELAA